jgi:hypothetical protein
MTRTRLIVGLITSHRTYLTITKTRKGRARPDPGCSAIDDDYCIILRLLKTTGLKYMAKPYRTIMYLWFLWNRV